MCGICGSFVYRDGVTSDAGGMAATGRIVRDSMAARGPDGAGEWQSPRSDVWLGHRRLAIIDLSPLGAQPMVSYDSSTIVTFNGEIYNFKELRADLEREGCEFRSTSDTEVLLQLYQRRGPGFVAELRGMFAFALWDERRRTLLCARDPYGIKPFYYADAGGAFLFASQVKALIHDPRIPRRLDPAGVAGFFMFGSVPEPWTVYESVKALPAGTTLLVDRYGVGTARAYHSIGAGLRAGEDEHRHVTSAEAQELVRAALLDSVRHHLVADVPVGAFLSAGVDSGALVGLMRDAGQSEIRTVTLSYREFRGSANDEAPLAAEVARYYGTDHTTRTVEAAEFLDDLPKILAAMDQPSVDGINTWFVSKAAREQGLKVAVSGAGGDELMGGYSTFRTVPAIARWTRGVRHLRMLSSILERGIGAAQRLPVKPHPKWAGMLAHGGDMAGAYILQRGLFLPHEMQSAIADPAFVSKGLALLQPHDVVARALQGNPRTAFGQVAALESSLYLRNQLLRDADWASMAHSIEIRTPLVDATLLARLAGVMVAPVRPSGKALLASAPAKPLPSAVVNRAKTGFGIPLRAWLSERSADVCSVKSPSAAFSRDWARRVAREHGVLPTPVVGAPGMARPGAA